MSTAPFYGDVDSVIARTGIGPTDLGFDDDDSLSEYISGVLAELSDTFDRFMRTSYLTSDIPAGLNGIANDAAAYNVAQQVASRQTPVVRIDDFRVAVSTSTVLTNDIKERLRLYGAGRGAVSIDLAQDSIADLPTIFTADQLDGDPADLP